MVVKIFFDGEEARFENERVEGGFSQQNVDAAFDERIDLFVIRFDHLIERSAAIARVFHIAGDGKLLVSRPDAAGHETRLFGIAGSELIGGASSKCRGSQVDFSHVILQCKIG